MIYSLFFFIIKVCVFNVKRFNKLDNEYDESDFRRTCGISHDIIFNDKNDYRLKYLYRSYRNICNVYRSNERYGFKNGYMEMLIGPRLKSY